MTPPPVEARSPAPHSASQPTPPVRRNDKQAPCAASAAQRKAFEKCLSRGAGAETDELDAEAGLDALPNEAAALACLHGPRQRALQSTSADELSRCATDAADATDAAAAAQQGSPSTAVSAQRGLTEASTTEASTSAGHTPPASQAKTSLYSHLALPHGADLERARFDVLGGPDALFSQLQLRTTAQAGTTVTVVAAAQHAALLEHHLPRLQRRLGEKVAIQVRGQSRQRPRDGAD